MLSIVNVYEIWIFEIKQHTNIVPERIVHYQLFLLFQVPSNTSELCCIIRASPGTRQVKSKGVIIKKKYSLPEDIPQGTVI